MSILINKDTKVITQGMTGKTGQFHTEKCIEYANGKNCFVAGVNPKKAGESLMDVPIFGTVADAKSATGATASVIYVPPAGAAAAIQEAVDADLDLVICITEGIPVRDMLTVRNKMRAKEAAGGKRTLLKPLRSCRMSVSANPPWSTSAVTRSMVSSTSTSCRCSTMIRTPTRSS